MLAPIQHDGKTRFENVYLLPNELDTRQLIVNTDVVVGFQTTALFESAAAGKPTLYTFWDPAAKLYASELIPFHLYGDLVTIIRSADDLRISLRQDWSAAPRGSLPAVEKHLGVIDGKASERVLEFILQVGESSRVQQAQKQIWRTQSLNVAKRIAKSAAAWLFWKCKTRLPNTQTQAGLLAERVQWHRRTMRNSLLYLMGK
jgi:hypothetical protein